MAVEKLKRREEVRKEDTWAIEDLYQDDKAWEEDYQRLSERIPKLLEFKGRLGDGAEVLLSMQSSGMN